MTIIDSVNITGMTRQDFMQLDAYIQWCEERGEYYGRKDYFDKRHIRIKVWIENILFSTAGSKIKGNT